MTRPGIIATLGPASQTPALWDALIREGASGLRLNTSHLTPVALRLWLRQLSRYNAARPQPLPIMLDLQGSKWRLGIFRRFTLCAGERVFFTPESESQQPHTLPVPHPEFFAAAQQFGGEIVLNDAKSRLMIETAREYGVTARVISGGEISQRKGITLPANVHRASGLGERDRAMLAQTRKMPPVTWAISYVRDAQELAAYRAELPRGAAIIAKIERRSALDDLDALAHAADALWLCRGDLAAEIGLREMAAAVHAISARVRQLPVPVWMAGQVLEHLTANPSPTRAELCNLFDVLAAGYAGVVLSDETATGIDPPNAVRHARLMME